MKNFLILIVFCLAATFSCGSKENPPTLLLSEVLTSSAWTRVINLEDIDLDGTFVEFGEDCEKDDIITFFADNKYEHNNGASVCDPDLYDPNSVLVDGKWELKNNDQSFFLYVGFGSDEFKVKSFTESELILEFIEASNPPGVITQRLVLRR